MTAVEKCHAALVDAKARLAEAQQQHGSLRDQTLALNQRGIEIEKAILGLQGEVKALEAILGSE